MALMVVRLPPPPPPPPAPLRAVTASLEPPPEYLPRGVRGEREG
jgi:hypothetical protein